MPSPSAAAAFWASYWVHRLMARGVAQGIPDGSPPAPALRDLIEAGLVEAYADEHYSLTAAGRALLEIAR
jgi:hypothetical protein